MNLTFREQAMIAAMQGALANPTWEGAHIHDIAHHARMAADALVDQLPHESREMADRRNAPFDGA